MNASRTKLRDEVADGRRASAVFVLIATLSACGGAPRAVGTPPAPADWSLFADEVRAPLAAAIARCRDAPSDPEAFTALGRLYHAALATDLALASYDAAVRLGASGPEIRHFRGMLLSEKGRAAEAAVEFRAA